FGQEQDPVTCKARCDPAAAPPACWVLSPANLLPTACDRDAILTRSFTGNVTIDTTDCALSGGVTRAQLGDAPELCVFRFSSVMLQAGASVTFMGSRVPVVVATDNMVLAGTINVAGKGEVGGPGTTPMSLVGRGGAGSCNGDQGGGGGGHAGSGGMGGAGLVTTANLPGGDKIPDETLSPIRGGGYGGVGGYPS